MRSRKSFVFNMKCQVTSDTTRKVMISRELEVASYKEICGGEKIKVYLGYNNHIMKVENNKLLPYPESKPIPGESRGESPTIAQNWEVLYPFFSIYNIEPVWLNCEFSWGHYDEEQGAWTGCMGKV